MDDENLNIPAEDSGNDNVNEPSPVEVQAMKRGSVTKERVREHEWDKHHQILASS